MQKTAGPEKFSFYLISRIDGVKTCKNWFLSKSLEFEASVWSLCCFVFMFLCFFAPWSLCLYVSLFRCFFLSMFHLSIFLCFYVPWFHCFSDSLFLFFVSLALCFFASVFLCLFCLFCLFFLFCFFVYFFSLLLLDPPKGQVL